MQEGDMWIGDIKKINKIKNRKGMTHNDKL
ncbi:hypothetical protein IGJ55_001067 [Enterococcus sp. AZ170]|nr:hypothetical protein [Enterococcus ureilyticus]